MEPKEFAAKLDARCERNEISQGQLLSLWVEQTFLGGLVVSFAKLDDTRETYLCWQLGIRCFIFGHVTFEMK